MIYLITILCVFAIAVGQILFKISANILGTSDSIFNLKGLTILFVALVIYALTTLLWVWILQKVDLGKIYPFMALAFIFVPIGSYFFLGENFNFAYWLGLSFVITGIVIITAFSN